MIMKMPTNALGGGGSSYGHGDGPGSDLDGDDYDSSLELDAGRDDDFSEYLWMENEEEFDKEEMQRLEEEALMEECIEAMLEEEEDDAEFRENNGLLILEPNEPDAADDIITWTIIADSPDLCRVLSSLKVQAPDRPEDSDLNPLAEEFVPPALHIYAARPAAATPDIEPHL